MKIDSALSEEMNLLMLFDLSNCEQGIKVHHDAEKTQIEAAQRLFNKGLISQIDGGYLTQSGIHTAEHLQHALNVLTD